VTGVRANERQDYFRSTRGEAILYFRSKRPNLFQTPLFNVAIEFSCISVLTILHDLFMSKLNVPVGLVFQITSKYQLNNSFGITFSIIEHVASFYCSQLFQKLKENVYHWGLPAREFKNKKLNNEK
jgi:hypothetical protein